MCLAINASARTLGCSTRLHRSHHIPRSPLALDCAGGKMVSTAEGRDASPCFSLDPHILSSLHSTSLFSCLDFIALSDGNIDSFNNKLPALVAMIAMAAIVTHLTTTPTMTANSLERT